MVKEKILKSLIAVACILLTMPSLAFAAAQTLYSPATPPPGYLFLNGSNDSQKAYMLNGGAASDITYGTSPGADYCNYYNSNNGPNSMGNQNNNDQYSVTGFRPADQPFNNWQEGDANSDTICQAELGTWGFKLQNGENNNCTTAGTACGIHHFARLNATYMPWGNYGAVPAQALTFSLSVKPQSISANPSGVWGYICPILKDSTSSKYIEYCFDNWEQGGGFPNVTHNDEIGDCGDFGGSSSLATIVTDFNSSSTWSTERAGTTSDSEKGSVILGTFVTQTASITSQNLQNAISQIRKSAPPRGVAHDGQYGCAYSDMSTNPANYQVIGFEDGMEGGGYSLLGESLTNEHMWVTTDTLFPGDTLTSGPNPNDGTMWSSDGNYKLVMQGDGNLVIYTKNNGFIWQSHSSGPNGTYQLTMQQGDGNLVVYKVAGLTKTAIWGTGTSQPGSYAVIQGDNNFVVYKGGQPQWSSQAHP